ncbi:MAG: hypothetical protein HY319_21050 [Armatimonadetes bacterium]|nr:hypothetical protein [Armatimonadota bacterium]
MVRTETAPARAEQAARQTLGEPEFITTTLSGSFRGSGADKLLNLPVALGVSGLRVFFGGREARPTACPRSSGRTGYQRALAQGCSAVLVEWERGLVSFRVGNLEEGVRFEWFLELSTPTGWAFDEEEEPIGGTVPVDAPDPTGEELCFLALAEPELGNLETLVALAADHTFRMAPDRKRELTSRVVQDLLREEGFELPVEAIRAAVDGPLEAQPSELQAPRPGLLSHHPIASPARTRLTAVAGGIRLGEGPLDELVTSALEALEDLCALPRELSPAASLKYEGERLLHAVRAGRFSIRFLEDWLERLESYAG